MVKVITIRTTGDLKKAVITLNRIKTKLPRMVRLGMRRWGKILERDMKSSIRRVSTLFTGLSQGNGIEWRQGKNSDTGHLFVRREYLGLDHMKPHFVNVEKGRPRLLRWAKQARNSEIRRRARLVEKGDIKPFSIYVKPHPWVASGFKRARPKLRPVLKRLVERGIQV